MELFELPELCVIFGQQTQSITEIYDLCNITIENFLLPGNYDLETSSTSLFIFREYSVKRNVCLLIAAYFHIEAATRGILCKKVSEACGFIKKRDSGTSVTFLRTLFLQNTSGRLLLAIVLPIHVQYNQLVPKISFFNRESILNFL